MSSWNCRTSWRAIHPLPYQYQPPTGYGDRAAVWMNTGALVSRLNFALDLAANGLRAATIDVIQTDPRRLAVSTLADDLSAATRAAIESTSTPLPLRLGLLLGSPEFQHR